LNQYRAAIAFARLASGRKSWVYRYRQSGLHLQRERASEMAIAEIATSSSDVGSGTLLIVTTMLVVNPPPAAGA
jgi:hypothetical protein